MRVAGTCGTAVDCTCTAVAFTASHRLEALRPVQQQPVQRQQARLPLHGLLLRGAGRGRSACVQHSAAGGTEHLLAFSTALPSTLLSLQRCWAGACLGGPGGRTDHRPGQPA